MYKPLQVGPLKISAITKAEFLTVTLQRLKQKQQTFVVTPYSEFLYSALRNNESRNLYNSADISIADGVGIFWAHLFLSLPLTQKKHWNTIMQLWWQVFISGAQILLRPKTLYRAIPEKIVGAQVFFDLCKLAGNNNYSVFLLNDWGQTARVTAEILQKKYPQLKISYSLKGANDESVLHDINTFGADLIFVGYGQGVQERWIKDNLPKTNALIAMGVGGTFDYAAGKKITPPKFIREMGLEWLFRLFTQPRRLPRIFRATFGLVLSLVRYKYYSLLPYRQSAVAVVVNKHDKILLCKRVPAPLKNGAKGVYINDYWQFPQGGIEPSEDLLSAAQRELQEETGISSVEVIGVANYQHQYEWSHGYRPIFVQQRPYNGQKQNTVFYRFLGDKSEIKVDEREFVDYQWCDADEVLNIIAPERKEHAQAVISELISLIRKSL